MNDIWAVIPVKEFDGAKHRLSGLLSPPERRLLAETMLTDVIDAVAGSRLLAGVMIVTLDPRARALGEKIGARIEFLPFGLLRRHVGNGSHCHSRSRQVRFFNHARHSVLRSNLA